jgi:hypothetical protein
LTETNNPVSYGNFDPHSLCLRDPQAVARTTQKGCSFFSLFSTGTFTLVTYPDLKGTELMNETLAQYSSLMVMEKLYGQSTVRQILQHEQRMYR